METISTEELKQKIDSGEDFKLVDVLSEGSFMKEHIPGSVNIPVDDIDDEAENLDQDQEIIVYCASESCGASPKAARKLERKGFGNVKDYEGGLKAWKEAGNETASA